MICFSGPNPAGENASPLPAVQSDRCLDNIFFCAGLCKKMSEVSVILAVLKVLYDNDILDAINELA